MLVPLVTRTEVLDFVLETLAEAATSWQREGLEYGTDVPLGVDDRGGGGAVPLVATWAEHVDFFALGTNDLTASALGMDRDDPVGGERRSTRCTRGCCG